MSGVNKKIKDFIVKYGAVVLAALATAVAVELMFLPNHVIYGTICGIASILDISLSSSNGFFQAGWWILILNFPLMIYSFFNYPRKFALRTSLYLVFLSGFMLLFRLFSVAEIVKVAESDTIALVLLGGGLTGVSLPLMLFVNGSTGGSDVLGLILQKRFHRSGSESFRFTMALDALTIVVGAIVEQNVEVFVYSISALFVAEIVKEFLFRGFSSNLEIEITTDNPEAVSTALRTTLNHGTTILKAQGGYSKTDKYVVVCVINKHQLTKARKLISEVDGKAFAYVENVREVIGLGFEDKEAEIEQITPERETKPKNKPKK